MKQVFFLTTSSLLVLITILFGCVKYKDYPNISFKEEQGYIYANTTLADNETFKVGIIASKNVDPLQNIVVTAIYGTDSLRHTLYTNILTGDSTNRYLGEYSFKTKSQQGIEKYTFSVESSKGIIASQTLTITVGNK